MIQKLESLPEFVSIEPTDLQYYDRRKKQAHGGQIRKQMSEKGSGQFVHSKTAEKLAEEHGVNESTVRRAGKLAQRR